MKVEEKYVELEGIRVHYLSGGEGSPLLLIHGLGNAVLSWSANIEPLALSHRIYALDLPGHGFSDKPAISYTVDYGVNFLLKFMDKVGIQEANVVGNSMGGLLAARLALDIPDRVIRLILVDAAGIGRDLAFFLRFLTLPLVGKLLYRTTSEKKVRFVLKKILFDQSLITDELVKEMYRYRSIPGNDENALKILKYGVNLLGQREKVVVGDRLPSLRKPTLILWGAQDRLIPVDHAYLAHKLIEGSILHIFQGCGHWPQMEKASEFNELLQEFLQSPLESQALKTP